MHCDLKGLEAGAEIDLSRELVVTCFATTHTIPSLGYIVWDPKDRGKGITTEAVQLFTKYLFDLKHIYRLQIQLQSDNIGSRRVAEKAQFRFVGDAKAPAGCGDCEAVAVYELNP